MIPNYQETQIKLCRLYLEDLKKSWGESLKTDTDVEKGPDYALGYHEGYIQALTRALDMLPKEKDHV